MRSGNIEDAETSESLLGDKEQQASGDEGRAQLELGRGVDGSGEEVNSVVWSATPMLVITTLVAVFGSLVFGSAVGYSSPTESGIMDDLDLSAAEYSFFGSILNIGAMVGAIMSGKIADYIGRRATMGFAELCCIIGWLSIAYSKVALWLDVGRLLVGYGIGIISYVVPVYIAEITPKNMRGGFTTVHQAIT